MSTESAMETVVPYSMLRFSTFLLDSPDTNRVGRGGVPGFLTPDP